MAWGDVGRGLVLSLALAATLVVTGACKPKADGELAPPFGLAWGMTAQEFTDLYRARNGDAAATGLAPDRTSGIDSVLTLRPGKDGAFAPWPPLPPHTAAAELDFSDAYGLVSVVVTGEDVADTGDGASYDRIMERYAHALAALVATNGPPTQGHSVNLGKTPQEKFHCLDTAAFCGFEWSHWVRPLTSAELDVSGGRGREADGWALRLRTIWLGPHGEENGIRAQAAREARAGAAAK